MLPKGDWEDFSNIDLENKLLKVLISLDGSSSNEDECPEVIEAIPDLSFSNTDYAKLVIFTFSLLENLQ